MENATKVSLVLPEKFRLEVKIPVPGGQSIPARFDMKYRRASEFNTWIESTENLANREFFDSIVVGWDLEEPFTPENVGKLLEVYPLAAAAVGVAYVAEYSRISAAG